MNVTTAAAAAATTAASPWSTLVKAAISVALLTYLLRQTDATRLWEIGRHASLPWLVAALALYFVMLVVSAWRWGLLLDAQDVTVRRRSLLSSFLVATFFNNFLPSNIGGDVVRIRDTAAHAGSRTRAAAVVLADRLIGVLGLGFVAALGASLGAGGAQLGLPLGPVALWVGLIAATALAAPAVLAPAVVGRVLRPLRILHPEWVDLRIARLTDSLARFRDRPGALVACFAGAIAVQALLVGFYACIVAALRTPIGLADLAVLVPASLVVQMLPVSLNGLGVREATFAVYFGRLGLPLESALAASLTGAALIMVFSLSGAAVYALRRR
jgi:uncharacterized membrane protein YbhN (UPF0104 family)